MTVKNEQGEVLDRSKLDIVVMDEEEKMSQEEKMAEIICHVRYSEEDKARWHKLITDFNALYWQMGVQTWGITRWRGVYVMKPPTDLWVYQELIYEIKPDLIIESGTCHGGSALFMRDVLDKIYPEGKIITIDISHDSIQEQARVPGIEYYLGGSTEVETITYLKAYIEAYKCQRVMVILDSDHEEVHVSKELELYAPLVTVGSILIVEDTSNHPGPIAAVNSWALRQKGFKKNLMGEKFMLTFNRDGYWEKIK
jgi:cephalosporin hydroxylase